VNYSILDTYRDDQENILGIKCTISGCELWLISIYGPNTNDRSFFTSLGGLIDRCGGIPVIVGGDWNTTVSTLDSPDNIDIYGMPRPPSIIRSQLLNHISVRYLLTDPFRALHPEKRDYSYVPRTGRHNRSRLDFFLISDSLLNFVNMAHISPSLTCSLFDHKPVFLNLGAPNILPDRKIFNSTLKNPLCDYVLLSSITDTYLNHSEPDTPNLLDYKNSLGRVFHSIREINRLDWRMKLEGEQHLAAERDLLALQLARGAETLPGIETLNDFNLTTTPDIFFEILCGNLKNELLGFQGYLNKLENAKLNKIHVDIENLKTNYNMNFEEIARLENMATSIRDQKLASRVSEMKIFENLHNEKATPIFLTLTKNKTAEKLSL
jgi:hypothetical protein